MVSKIEELTLSKAHKRALLILVKAAELYESKTPTKPLYLKLEDTFLKSATELIKVYLKKQRITAVDGSILLGMIQSLENKH